MAAKALNFGIVYGRTASSIANDPDLSTKLYITPEMAQEWIDGWAARFPVAWAFIQKCRKAVLQNQTLVSPFGNKKRPGVVSRDKIFALQNEFANFFHQNIASNINLHAGMKLFDPLKQQYDTHIFNTVHDCIVTETPFRKIGDPVKAKEHVLATAAFMQQVMEREAKLWGLKRIHFRVQPEFGFAWGNVLKFHEIEEKYGGDFSRVPSYIPAH